MPRYRRSKRLPKPEQMSPKQAWELLRLCVDIADRYTSDVKGMMPSLMDAIDQGMAPENYDRLRRTLWCVNEKSKKIYRRLWTALFCLNRVSGLNVTYQEKNRLTRRRIDEITGTKRPPTNC